MFNLRRAVRSVTWLVMLSFLPGMSLPVWDSHPIGLSDDAACQLATAGEAGPQQHVDSSSAIPGLPDHCVFCHLQRAMAGATAAQAVALLVPAAHSAATMAGERAPRVAPNTSRLSRAPPASLTV